MAAENAVDRRISSSDNSSDVVFGASYTAKDLILYALSIGFGSSRKRYQQDLRFVYEDHPDFTAVPMFGLVLLFWAQQIHKINDDGNYKIATARTLAEESSSSGCADLLSFPPPLMRSMGVLPRGYLRRNDVDLNDYPILHTFLSIAFHNHLPVPSKKNGRSTGSADGQVFVKTLLRGRFVSVEPRSVGTFVTTETTIGEDIPLMEKHVNAKQSASASAIRPLCTVMSTALILGLDKDLVEPWAAPKHSSNKTAIHQDDKERDTMILEETCTIDSNQALLYRLASGDSNAIHVDPTAVLLSSHNATEDSSSSVPAVDRPLLHGLCTMGIAARIIMQHLESEGRLRHLSMRRLEGRFVKPVFVGDSIVVQAWKMTAKNKRDGGSSGSRNAALCIDFLVRNKTTDENVLDEGRMLFVSSTMPSRL